MERAHRQCAILYLIFSFFLLNLCFSEIQAMPHSGKKTMELLIIHSFDNSLSDYPRFNHLVTEVLKKEKIQANIQIFYLDCDAYDKDGEIRRINNYLDTISMRPDIILVTDDQATYSLLASKHSIVKTTPVVFSGVNFPNWDLLEQYSNVTGIWDNPNYEKNVRMIEKLVGIKRIRFFYDKTYNGKRVIGRLAEQYKEKDKELYNSLTHFLQYKDSIKNELDIENTDFNMYLKGSDYGDRPTATSFHFINMRDELGKDLLWNISGNFKYSVFLLTKYDYTIAQVGRLATVPTFSATNKGFTYNQGILGGYFTPVEEQVKETCDYIKRIFSGESISQLPIKESSSQYLIDWEVLKRWNVSLEEVPDEFKVVNIPFYIKYRTEAILSFSAFILFIVLLVIYLLFLYRREAKRKREAQSNLWEEKEFLSLALEKGNIFAWRFNHANNEFVFDEDFFDGVAVSSRIIPLKDMIQMTHPDEQEDAISTFFKVVNGIEDRANLHVRVDFNGKGYVWYEFRILNILGILGDKSSVIGLVMNIQNYKDKEEELTIARDLASKAELKQSFLANMSHEIRTPLNAIVGFSNMLVSDEDLASEEKMEYILIINKNCELLLKLINDILEISRLESGSMSFSIEPCNMNDLIEDVYNTFTLQTPPDVAFLKKTLEEPLCIKTDIVRIKQVLTNFVNNAFKFTCSGSVTIGMENNEEEKEVCIYVEDTGGGIPESQLKMIFNRFYKVNEFAQGTGLGLSICQVIVDKLNGKIAVTSEEGKGSRFSIVLFYADQIENDLPPEIETISHYAQIEETNEGEDRPVVLIAEDSASNYMVLNNILKGYFKVIWVVNGKDALEVVKKRKVDIVLMDIKMHEMDGITAAKKIRKIFKNLPIIFQTAYACDENRELADQAGGAGFITKPVRPDELLNLINQCIK